MVLSCEYNLRRFDQLNREVHGPSRDTVLTKALLMQIAAILSIALNIAHVPVYQDSPIYTCWIPRGKKEIPRDKRRPIPRKFRNLTSIATGLCLNFFVW